jgi:dipeptidyl-peptidase-4
MYLLSAIYISSCPVFTFIFMCSYYQSTPENKPSQRHVYAVAVNGSSDPYCLSCNITTPEGRTCLYASGSFSTDMSHLALTCSGPDPPHVSLYKAGSDSPLEVWENNENLRQKIEGRDLPQIIDTDVVVDEGFMAKARLWLPPGADTSGLTKYPMLVYV